MNQNFTFRLAANKWVIKARWFYVAVIALLCLAWHTPNLIALNWADFSLLRSPLLSLLVMALLANALLWAIARMIDEGTEHRYVPVLSFLQLIAEVILISLLMSDLPGLSTFISVLFFVPVIESIVFFGYVGPLLVAILAMIILNFLFFSSVSSGSNLGLVSVWLLIFSVIYWIVGKTSFLIFAHISKERPIRSAEDSDDSRQLAKDISKQEADCERDARALRAKEFELEMANRRLEKLEEAKSKFVSVTAHQLRTPLSAIKWTFEMIQSGKLGAITGEQKEFLDKGFESAQRMIRIVNDLLRMDQMETEKTADPTFAKFDLGKMIQGVVAEFSNQAVSKEIDFKVESISKSLPPIEGDQEKLQIVLENLLDNAVKYTPRGGKIVLIVSDAKINSSRQEVEIIVKDSGIGIPETEKSKVFSKFFRAQNAISAEPDGSGVGLYLSKDIVDRHGGSLWYEKLAESGTAFHLTLPLRQKS